jgi:hypothetical protein
MSQIEIAKAIATLAHRGQTDKAGEPYIEHPRRVAKSVADKFQSEESRFYEQYVAAAWLHDVLEDSEFTTSDLENAGIEQRIIKAVLRLTHEANESRDDYYERVKGDYISRGVKLADIHDNLDARRLAKLDDATIVRLVKKYAKGLEALA